MIAALKDLSNRPKVLILIGGLLTGMLHGFSWPNFQVMPFCFIFLVPSLFVLPSLRTLKQVMMMGLVAGMTSSVIGFYWISEVAVSFGGLPRFLAHFVTLGYSLIGQTQYLFFFGLLWALLVKKINIPLWVIAALYTVADFLWPKIFCDTEGAMLLSWSSLAQTAEWTSVYGLTFLCVYANGLFLNGLNLIKAYWVGEFPAHKKPLYHLMMHAGVFGVLIFALHLWGGHRIAELKLAQAGFPRSFRATVIQANIGDADKLASEQGIHNAVGQVLGNYSRLSFQALTQTQRPDLLIWPETAYPFIYSHLQDTAANEKGEARDRWIKQMMTELPPETSFFFGSYSRNLLTSEARAKEYNTAFLLTHPFELKGQYRKSILLAFGEYVPLGPFSEMVTKAIPSIGNFERGQGASVFDWEKAKLGPLICYESIAQGYARESALKGAEVFINITNDSWFGDTSEPFSHLYLTAFRSIELRRPLIRATNTGITALIDITGEILGATPLFKTATPSYEVKVPEGLSDTLVMRFGYWFIWTLCVFLVGWLAFIRKYLNTVS